jgi:hypothetical protein
MLQKLKMQMLHIVLPKILGGLLYAYLCPPYAADDVSGELWQFLSAVHDKGDGLTFFE